MKYIKNAGVMMVQLADAEKWMKEFYEKEAGQNTDRLFGSAF